jgi:c(7)-type cytochrome triheme protein
MKPETVFLSVFFIVAVTGSAWAVGPDKTLEYKGSPTGTVVFDGAAHKKAGLTCSDCHNPLIFPKMKKGSIKITMSDLYAGKYCGRCHNGRKAFQILDNCTRCHHKKGAAK